MKLALALTLTVLGGHVAPGRNETAPDDSLARLAPHDSLLYVESNGASRLLEAGLRHPLARSILGSPLGVALEQAGERSPSEVLARLDQAAGLEVLPTLARLTRHGVALSVGLRRARPAWLLALRAEDDEVLASTLAFGLRRVAQQAGAPGSLDEPAERVDGAELWRIGDELRLARRGALALASNDEDVLRQALSLAAGRAGQCLAENDAFLAARATRRGHETLWSWLDLGRARALQELVGGDKGLVRLAQGISQPAVQLLLGPGLAAVGRAQGVTLAASLREEDLGLRLVALGVDAGAASALLPGSTTRLAPWMPARGDDVAQAVVYRDLAAVFAVRNELFAPELQPRFAEAESNLALFFGGADVAESVLPHLGPWIGAVARGVPFSQGAVPDVPLPALALLASVDDPDGVGSDLIAAFQTAIGLVNVDRAQKGLDPLRLELSRAGEATVTSARFRPPGPDDGVDLRYNLEPACALVDGTLIVGTHVALVTELAQGLQRETSTASAPTGERLHLSGPALAELVARNRELLVMDGILKEGKTRAKAEGDIDGLHALADLVETLRLTVGYPAPDRVVLELDLDLHAGERAR